MRDSRETSMGAMERAVDRDVVLAAVREDGRVLQHTTSELRADREVVLEAVGQYPWALGYAAPALRADREVVLKAVRQARHTCEAGELTEFELQLLLAGSIERISVLEYAAPELRADREVVLEAVRQDGYALKHASLELRSDKEVVLEAVRQSCYALWHAGPDLCADREVVMEAMRQYGDNSDALEDKGHPFEFAASELRADREVALEAVRQGVSALSYVAPELLADREVVLEAMRENRGALEYLSPQLRGELISDPSFRSACESRIALPSSASPVCTITTATLATNQIRYEATVSLSGDEISGELGLDATLGDLALQLSNATNGSLVRMIFPGVDAPISPLFAMLPLRQFL